MTKYRRWLPRPRTQRQESAARGENKLRRRCAVSERGVLRVSAPGEKRRLLRPAERVGQVVRVRSSSIPLRVRVTAVPGAHASPSIQQMGEGGKSAHARAATLALPASVCGRAMQLLGGAGTPHLFKLHSEVSDETDLPAAQPHAEGNLPIRHDPTLPRVRHTLVEHPCGGAPVCEDEQRREKRPCVVGSGSAARGREGSR